MQYFTVYLFAHDNCSIHNSLPQFSLLPLFLYNHFIIWLFSSACRLFLCPGNSFAQFPESVPAAVFQLTLIALTSLSSLIVLVYLSSLFSVPSVVFYHLHTFSICWFSTISGLFTIYLLLPSTWSFSCFCFLFYPWKSL